MATLVFTKDVPKNFSTKSGDVILGYRWLESPLQALEAWFVVTTIELKIFVYLLKACIGSYTHLLHVILTRVLSAPLSSS